MLVRILLTHQRNECRAYHLPGKKMFDSSKKYFGVTGIYNVSFVECKCD